MCVCYLQDALLELLCDAVVSSERQGKGLVISGFPRDLRQAQDYEAKVRAQSRRSRQRGCGQKREQKKGKVRPESRGDVSKVTESEESHVTTMNVN